MDFLVHDILSPTLWVLFTLGCIVISGIILLQEGKGGGLGEAFGGAGAQTFGVKAQGIAKVTGYIAGGLVLVAIGIALIESSASSVDFGSAPVPIDGGASGSTDASGATQDTAPIDTQDESGGIPKDK